MASQAAKPQDATELDCSTVEEILDLHNKEVRAWATALGLRLAKKKKKADTAARVLIKLLEADAAITDKLVECLDSSLMSTKGRNSPFTSSRLNSWAAENLAEWTPHHRRGETLVYIVAALCREARSSSSPRLGATRSLSPISGEAIEHEAIDAELRSATREGTEESTTSIADVPGNRLNDAPKREPRWSLGRKRTAPAGSRNLMYEEDRLEALRPKDAEEGKIMMALLDRSVEPPGTMSEVRWVHECRHLLNRVVYLVSWEGDEEPGWRFSRELQGFAGELLRFHRRHPEAPDPPAALGLWAKTIPRHLRRVDYV